MGNKMKIRFAKKEELERVNLIRKQVSDLHSKGRPDIFYPDFKGEICNCIYDIFNDETKKIIVAVEKAEICGMAIIQENGTGSKIITDSRSSSINNNINLDNSEIS